MRDGLKEMRKTILSIIAPGDANLFDDWRLLSVTVDWIAVGVSSRNLRGRAGAKFNMHRSVPELAAVDQVFTNLTDVRSSVLSALISCHSRGCFLR